MPAARRSKRVSDENRPYTLSNGKGKGKGKQPPAAEEEKRRWPCPKDEEKAIKEFKKRCPGKSCRTCDSAPGLTVSHCPLCEHDATSAMEFFHHLQGHIDEMTENFRHRETGEDLEGHCCLLKDCVYEDGMPHVHLQPRNITAHVCSHINNRPYVCECCGKRFADPSVLDKHVKNAREKGKPCGAMKLPSEVAAAANGDSTEDGLRAKQKPKKMGRKSSKRGKKTENDFPGIPESVRKATPVNEEPIAGPSSSSSSRIYPFAPPSSSSSRRFNTSMPTVTPSYMSQDHFAEFSPWVNSDPSPAPRSLAVENCSFASSMDASFDALLAPADDIWWPSIPPANADDYLYRPAVPSTAQVQEYSYDVESFDPAPYSPPRFDLRAFELEFNNAPPPYPSPTVDYPAVNSSTNAASMPYLPDTFPAGAPETWYPLWDFFSPGYLPNAPGNSS